MWTATFHKLCSSSLRLQRHSGIWQPTDLISFFAFCDCAVWKNNFTSAEKCAGQQSAKAGQEHFRFGQIQVKKMIFQSESILRSQNAHTGRSTKHMHKASPGRDDPPEIENKSDKSDLKKCWGIHRQKKTNGNFSLQRESKIEGHSKEYFSFVERWIRNRNLTTIYISWH